MLAVSTPTPVPEFTQKPSVRTTLMNEHQHMLSKTMRARDSTSIATEMMQLLKDSQFSPYIGEAISQQEHMLQAAYHAKLDGCRNEVVLAALLHDFGHICAEQDAEQMGDPTHGTAHHEFIGATYLRVRGFSEEIISMVAAHVDAKRYLTWKRGQEYYSKLSPASSFTLMCQGGPMNEAEATAFEHDPLFAEKLAIRYCDEKAKIAPHPEHIPTADSYIPLLAAHIDEQRRLRQSQAVVA
ncbi:HDIG domain-containing protein [Capsaspora owczarzaki ATCC 30864]|uniref:HDIG domain-containing protein n=1 Tax=Capsaspora owczarzaki (strain ATCC 30864) TaxID=595528 RepID=A0A0D2VMA2_CAPO3|nr:HDIG domain-containing protein [Capsaspora owczarzaki ATCC 30864]KJE91277.1 HDIG domain-containing protein [Capsaspora owczarzaki ATCC 30864]|eukprot:XP_004349186.1 HDIG domain-containing protein [Capsaspora owczarzaki ATCC 30864]